MHPPDEGPEKAKPPNPDSLAAQGMGVSEQAELSDKLKRYGTAKNRNHQMAGFLVAHSCTAAKHSQAPVRKLARRMYDCGTELHFRHYIEHQRTQLVRSNSCKLHIMCPLCAIRRGAYMLRRYKQRFDHLASGYDFDLVTLTVKNGPDLAERTAHLRTAHRKLRERARKGYGALADHDGALWSTEFTRSPDGWHPHLHMILARPEGSAPLMWGQGSPLAEDWRAVTGDSYIVHAERIAPNHEGICGALCETLKYAVKFGDLTLSDNWEAFCTLKGKRLIASSGVLYGLVLPDEADLDDDELDGPFIDFFFRFMGSSGYRLQNTPARTIVDVA
jgi:Replication protein